jgi:hypothetical protein
MAKKALCVGINDYPLDGNDLKGCVNDANGWADLLVEHYGFDRKDVSLLIDADATKVNIMTHLETMITEAMPGDVLVFTNASHGTYVADNSGDEETYDEALCPYDCAENLIVDDELRELFATLPDGVSLTVILDSCFSGTGTRAPDSTTADDRRVRFLHPQVLRRATLRDIGAARSRAQNKFPESTMNDVLLSGCADRQTSNDALIDGRYHGAMSYFALQAIREADYRITLQKLATRLCELFARSPYEQNPQLEGRAANKKKLIFTA